MVITAKTQVRDIVVESPNAILVLERFGIDYCCGGEHTLAEACTKRAQNVTTVLNELELQMQNTITSEIQWDTAPLRALIGYIVQKHHAFTREQLTLVNELAGKVERRHGATHPEAREVKDTLAVITSELTHHFSCEEGVLFPFIEQLTSNEPTLAGVPFVSAQQPVTRMMMDHSHTGDELRVLREITNDFRPPDDACPTYRALYRALEDLERDLHRHIHLENNILFPRALELEGQHS